MTRPITPKEAWNSSNIPAHVIECFNDLIRKNLRGKEADVTQDAVIEAICWKTTKDSYGHGNLRKVIINNRWLDVEDVYRSVGWEVEYDKPGYNETYPAVFRFKMRDKDELHNND